MVTREDRLLVEELKDLRNKVNWNIEEERCNFLVQLYLIFKDREDREEGPFPAVHFFLRPEEIHRLLWDSINYNHEEHGKRPGDTFIRMAAADAYRDEPEADENGITSPRRTTLIHHALKNSKKFAYDDLFPHLFQICGSRLDVNYTDESGCTHFHAACQFSCVEVVQGFLEHGQDPNCIWSDTGDSALHLALERATFVNSAIIEMLLRGGADPNIANKEGLTPLHAIAKEDFDCEIVELFFQINDELNQRVQVDARDKLGSTPIHLALKHSDRKKMMEVLLRKGASPNLSNDEGSTPLHIICKRDMDFCDDFAESFFKINEELNQRVLVDARDKLGRTPLQCAVVNCSPYVVESLLNHGADLSSFAFPTWSQFDDCFASPRYKYIQSKLLLAFGLLAVIECLEKKGYELDRSEVLIIMKLFNKYKLFKAMKNLDERWYDNEEFAKEARETMVKPDLSLYDLIHLRPHEAAKRLTYMACCKISSQSAKQDCFMHLYEMMSSKFFRSWALEPFWKLIHYRLPLECCELILENLQNKDLYHIFLATEGQTNTDSKINVITNAIKRKNERPIRARKAPKRLQIEW